MFRGHKAPSAKRCIKTVPCSVISRPASVVTKHRAPKGALRLVVQENFLIPGVLVTKHRAPKGALRP